MSGVESGGRIYRWRDKTLGALHEMTQIWLDRIDDNAW